MTIALIDGNNFYAACEQSIDPSLVDQPLVVLSNNDGCIISRNAEAKAFGIPMGAPFFKVRTKLKQYGVKIRSSNYALYGDMSERFMNLIKNYCEELEIYSIDEAFVNIKRPMNCNLHPWAKELRTHIYQNLSLPIAIGIGATKTQAKLANYLAKKVADTAGIFDLEISKHQEDWLESIAVENVWGIGHKMAQWCRLRGINNALQLRDAPSHELKAKLGITGIRLQNELKGVRCIPFAKYNKAKKETCVSRSFNKPITTMDELRQAISSYAVRASEKLRKQNQVAGIITIFTRTSLHKATFYSKSASKRLKPHSNDTSILLNASLALTPEIFKQNLPLIKAGVIMQDLQEDKYLQLHLFETYNSQSTIQRKVLMQTIDNLNQRYGSNTVRWTAYGTSPTWSMRRKYLSPSATTRLTDIPIVIS